MNPTFREPEEGGRCFFTKCKGTMQFSPSENCSCHISPPCSSCLSVYLFCSECGFDEHLWWDVLEELKKTEEQSPLVEDLSENSRILHRAIQVTVS